MWGKYSIHIDEESTEKRPSLNESFAIFRGTKNQILVTYPLVLETMVTSTYSKEEHWFIPQSWRCGKLYQKLVFFWMLKLCNHWIAERHNDFIGQVFCFLPLPPYTSLPVYINGHILLISNRRSLWVITTEDPNDKTRWNDSLIEAIASSYVQFFEKAKNY